jgi:hypothetical protein
MRLQITHLFEHGSSRHIQYSTDDHPAWLTTGVSIDSLQHLCNTHCDLPLAVESGAHAIMDAWFRQATEAGVILETSVEIRVKMR